MNPQSASQVEHLRQLTAKLKENLALCTAPKDHEPTVDAAHDVRTGTRRIEAILDSMQTSMQRNSHSPPPQAHSPAAALPDGLHALLDSMQTSMQRNSHSPSPQAESAAAALSDAIARWQRLLRKIRR